MSKLVQVAKFGGSVLTYSDREPAPSLDHLLNFPELYIREEKELRRQARETYRAWNEVGGNLILFFGVKQYGHRAVDFLGIDPSVRKYCEYLAKNVAENFRKEGVPLELVDFADTCEWDDRLKIFRVERLIKREQKIIEGKGIPVSWGTVIDSMPSGYHIMSGDDGVMYAALKLKAQVALMFLDVPVCDKDPKRHPDAKPLDVIRSYRDLNITVSEHDKTGGLIGKIKKLELPAKAGTKCQIVDATKEGNIYRSFKGEVVGTLIQP